MNQITPGGIVKLVAQADSRIRPFIRETILEPSPYFGELASCEVFFKCENLQCTGSFKVRGALSKILALPEASRKKGVVAASTGNHGAAVAYTLNQAKATGLIFVPEGAIETKVAAIRRFDVEVHRHGRDPIETELFARRYAQENSLEYISPYNDPLIVAGQGTIGVELARQLSTLDTIIVSVGGGGLISGVAAFLKSVWSGIEVIGCSPENSQVMIQSVTAGKILDLPSLPTLSDGTAGGVEQNAITLPLCASLVDRFVTVSEDEITHAMREFMQTHHMLIEGSAAAAIAALVKGKRRLAGKRVAVVLCGANISLETLKKVL